MQAAVEVAGQYGKENLLLGKIRSQRDMSPESRRIILEAAAGADDPSMRDKIDKVMGEQDGLELRRQITGFGRQILDSTDRIERRVEERWPLSDEARAYFLQRIDQLTEQLQDCRSSKALSEVDKPVLDDCIDRLTKLRERVDGEGSR
jgi:hypothetical protein